jgi:hypothetical protein
MIYSFNKQYLTLGLGFGVPLPTRITVTGWGALKIPLAIIGKFAGRFKTIS